VKWILGLCIGIMAITQAHARLHAVAMQVKLTGATVTVEGFYDDDAPTVDALVSVTDAQGATIHEGKTDTSGVWTFPTPAPGTYKIRLNAGDGHVATKTLTITALPSPEPTDRQAFTRFPWERLAVGLGVIALVTVGWWWRRRRR
jgi:hypothetical protein